MTNERPGVSIEIPGFGRRDIRTLASDFSGTLSFNGVLSEGVRERLLQLSELMEIHILTSDTFGTAQRALAEMPVHVEILAGEHHELQKEFYVQNRLDPRYVAALGNGNNDRLMLKAVREAGGLAIAIDNGEGCATASLLNSNLLIHKAAGALDLLLEPNRIKATLRF